VRRRLWQLLLHADPDRHHLHHHRDLRGVHRVERPCGRASWRASTRRCGRRGAGAACTPQGEGWVARVLARSCPRAARCRARRWTCWWSARTARTAPRGGSTGIQLKLGLLGKVIGFSVLALEIGQIQNFDPAQSAQLLPPASRPGWAWRC
jgi:hypothetical protein